MGDEHAEYRFTIRDLPAGERPRERLRGHGAGVLSTQELLAIILRSGSASESVVNLAQRLLHDFHGLLGLHAASFDDLCRVHGLGEAKVCQLKAAFELGQRLRLAQGEERTPVRSPADVANLLLLEMGGLEQEHLKLVLLDGKNRVMAVVDMYKGSVNHSQVRVGELFREAIRRNSSALVVVHNHPSGDPAPSPDDVRVTEEIVRAGKLLDVEVLDHIIMGRGRYFSLKEKGLGFTC